jgi:hypothetical protein
LLAGGKTSESERPGTMLPLREEHRSNGQNDVSDNVAASPA